MKWELGNIRMLFIYFLSNNQEVKKTYYSIGPALADVCLEIELWYQRSAIESPGSCP